MNTSDSLSGRVEPSPHEAVAAASAIRLGVQPWIAAFGAMLHAVNHSLTKGLLFLVSGNILAAYRTKSVAGVRGLVRVAPATGVGAYRGRVR